MEAKYHPLHQVESEVRNRALSEAWTRIIYSVSDQVMWQMDLKVVLPVESLVDEGMVDPIARIILKEG